ncbi:YbaN family protein [Dysgonomonas sp. 520]|uniref:YbaN family protein n=1 Tax=Dysgonomonas sp. 520 TaxID=2302931 RepID=UPI0013D6982C|nr:YbaN family protein [Dysgonomonas sp. 520]NDW10763.1 DUF454 domain-containing protein [Dysgonomonas sp. 520]
MKLLYIILGSISLALGLLGIITPGLPTTPFILLTGYLYARSSDKLYNKLKNNKITGRYLNKVSKGLSFKEASISVLLMWCMILFTAFVIFPYGKMRFVMLGLGIIGTVSQYVVLCKRRWGRKMKYTYMPESKDKLKTIKQYDEQDC